MDQVPLEFLTNVSKQTLSRGHDENGKSVPAWTATLDFRDKRQATLMPCICPVGTQVVPITIIFRGGGAVNFSEEELATYLDAKGQVHVAFQPAAWADTFVMLHWLKAISIPSVRGAGINGPIMLGMDRHGPHIGPA